LVAASALATGKLREVLTGWTEATEDVAVYYPSRRTIPPALRAFLDVVRDVGGN
jgi:DNA-binding transcriptional LysR family regulator